MAADSTTPATTGDRSHRGSSRPAATPMTAAIGINSASDSTTGVRNQARKGLSCSGTGSGVKGGRRPVAGVGAFADCCLVQVSVDRRAGYAEQVGDLLDGVIAGVVELLSVKCLCGRELRPTAAGSATCSSGGEAVAGVGDDEFALQFGQDGEHAEHGAAFGGGGVDALLEHLEADAAFAE